MRSLDDLALDRRQKFVEHDSLGRRAANERRRLRRMVNDGRQVRGRNLLSGTRRMGGRDDVSQLVQLARPTIERKYIQYIRAERTYLLFASSIPRFKKALCQ